MTTHFSFKPGCAIHPFHGGSGDEYIIETADARRFKVSGAALQMLEQLNEGASLEEVCARSEHLECEALRALILRHYGGFLVRGSGETFGHEPHAAAKSAAKSLLIGRTILSRNATITLSSKLQFLYSPVAAVLMLLAIISSHIVLYLTHSLAPQRLTGAHASAAVLLCVASILAHELGHASALLRYGGSPSGVGFGLYILMPVFYADVSQAWRLRQWQRVLVDLGGVYFQQIFFTLAAALSILFDSPSLRVVCIAIDFMTFIALNPALRFDGYWVIADWLGLADLHGAAMTYLRSLLASLRGRGNHQYPQRLSRTKTAAFICYALLSNLFMAALVLMNFRWLRSAILSLLTGLPELGAALIKAVVAGEWIHSADLSVACLFLLASGTTVLVGVYYQTRTCARLLRARLSRRSGVNSEPVGEAQ